MKLYICLFLLVFSLAGCRGVSYQYQGEDKKIDYVTDVPIGATKATFGFGTATNNALPFIESDYPTILGYYGSASNEVYNLKQLDFKLIVDGKEIQPDIEEFSASYVNSLLEFDKKDCCAVIGERLGIDRKQKDADFGFSVQISKKYKSLKRLPPQITVVLSATTDKGITELTKVLNLSEYKDTGFIRVH